MIKIDKVICIDIGIKIFYMCLYVYIYMFIQICIICFSVRLFIPTHIHSVLIGDSLDCILMSPIIAF